MLGRRLMGRARSRVIHVAAMPACFDNSKAWQEWLSLARLSRTSEAMKRSGYCIDCTEQWQHKMIRQQRCAHPGTTFVPGNDGVIRGRRPGDAEAED